MRTSADTIKMKEKYTVSELAIELEISERTVRRRLEGLIKNSNGKYLIDFKIYELLKENNSPSDNSGHLRSSTVNGSQYEHIEYFTENEYQEFHKRLVEYPLLKEQLENSREVLKQLQNDLEYHRNTYQKHLEIYEKLISSINQRNFIEAKEKGLE